MTRWPGPGGRARPERWLAPEVRRYRPTVALADPATIDCSPGDHVCWVFESDDDLRTAAVAFLDDGLRRGESLVYVGDAADESALRSQLATLGDVDRLIADGTLQVQLARALYVPAGRAELATQVESYRTMTNEALASGRSGLRVAADATCLVTDDDQRRAFMAYEIAVDRYIANAPMTAMCAYDHRALGDAAGDLACVHRRWRTPDASSDPRFSLYAVGQRLIITGDIDISNSRRFSIALDAAAVATPGPDLEIDLTGLSFIDLKGVAVLADFARALPSDRTLCIDDARGLVTIVANAMGWDDVAALTSSGSPA
jgi:anti-anti-sigma regulatory factor